MRAYNVSWISAELLRSQRGASPAAAALSAARRLVHRMDRSTGYANRLGGRRPHRHPPKAGCCGSDPRCGRVCLRPSGIGRDLAPQWRAAGQRSAQVFRHSARRYYGVRRAGWRGDPAAAPEGRAQAANAARNDLASDRRGRTISAAISHRRATEFILRHRCFCRAARRLRSRHAWARVSRDPLGLRDGGGLQGAAVLCDSCHATVARSYRRSAYVGLPSSQRTFGAHAFRKPPRTPLLECRAKKLRFSDDRARQLGWTSVEVVDNDLGRSGGRTARPGCDRLIGAICAGNVGAVLALEASRLARNGRDWHMLIEFCGLVATIIVDEDGIYDPRHPNDRLLLGMKGTMSELE